MPTYSYQCKNCLKIEEINIPIKDYTSSIPCTICRSTMDRIFTAIPFKFAGLSTGTTLTNEGKYGPPKGMVTYEEGKEIADSVKAEKKKKKLTKEQEKFIMSLSP